MYPRIIFTDSLSLPSYTIIYIIAIILGLALTYRECLRYQLPIEHFAPTAFCAVISGFAGAKGFEIVFYQWNQFVHYPIDVLLHGGGWMYYGAEIGGVLGGAVYLLIKRVNILRPLDVAGLALMPAHAFGRLGCFCAGCCYGTETNGPLGIQFPNLPRPVHPTQIYETVALLPAFILALIFRSRFAAPGTLYATYLMYYGMVRFFIEKYRYDAYKFGFLYLSPSQYIALTLTVIGSILFSYSYLLAAKKSSSPQ